MKPVDLKNKEPIDFFYLDMAKMSVETYNYFRSKITEIRVKKGTAIVYEGDCSDRLYFLKEGVARCFYNIGDKERIVWFAGSNTLLASPYALLPKDSSNEESIDLLTNCIIRFIRKEDYNLLCEQFSDFMFSRLLVTEKLLQDREYYIKMLMMLDDKKKYEWLFQTYPMEVTKELTIKHIANHLLIGESTIKSIRRDLIKSDNMKIAL
jgi:hypothetical protein